MKRILVLAPHADDAEFGLGGYMARLFREATAEVDLTIFAHGDYLRADGEWVTFACRRQEASAAADLLGVRNLRWVPGFFENQGDTAGIGPLAHLVEVEVGRAAYDTVFAPLPSYNQDHRALFSAVCVAFRPNRFDRVRELWAYEYPGNAWVPKEPVWGRRYVRLSTEELVLKLQALAEHKSQFAKLAFNTGHCAPAGATHLARWRGSECGAEQAELFYLLRAIE